MGEYKKDNGTTQVGDFLRSLGSVGKPILKAAAGLTGQGWLSSIADGIKTSTDLADAQKNQALELHALDVQDRTSAREMTTSVNLSANASWLPKNMAGLLAIVTTLMVGSLIWGLMTIEVPERNEPIVYALVGTVSTAWLACIYFWVGSSMGSKDKTEGMIRTIKKM